MRRFACRLAKSQGIDTPLCSKLKARTFRCGFVLKIASHDMRRRGGNVGNKARSSSRDARSNLYGTPILQVTYILFGFPPRGPAVSFAEIDNIPRHYSRQRADYLAADADGELDKVGAR
jgi:hypothetical protein